MRKFRFKLSAVEQVRKNKEREALTALSDAQRILQAEISRKIKLLQALDDSLNRREKLSLKEASSVDYRVEEDFITGNKIRIQSVDRSILRASKGVEKAMAHYLQCRKQRKMVDKLREKALEAHQDEQATRENRAMDDLSIMRFRINKGVA